MARFARPITIPAGASWPEGEGGSLPGAFRWVRVENRAAAGSGNDLVIALDALPGTTDDAYDFKVKAGTCKVKNVSGHTDDDPFCHRIHVRNVGTGSVVAYVELDTEPIVGMEYDLDPSSTQLDTGNGAVSATNPLPVNDLDQFGNVARSISGAGDGLGTTAAMQPSSAGTAPQVSAANASAAWNAAGVAGQAHRLTMLTVSYSGAPAGGRVLVWGSVGGNYIDLDITASGVSSIPLPPGGLKAAAGETLNITLYAGGAGVVGKLNAAKVTA